jgi:hypothetical protein
MWKGTAFITGDWQIWAIKGLQWHFGTLKRIPLSELPTFGILSPNPLALKGVIAWRRTIWHQHHGPLFRCLGQNSKVSEATFENIYVELQEIKHLPNNDWQLRKMSKCQLLHLRPLLPRRSSWAEQQGRV